MSIANALRCDGCGRPFLGPGDSDAAMLRTHAAATGWTRPGSLDHCPMCTESAAKANKKLSVPKGAGI